METLQTEDGQHFVRSLAQFIRQHEKALANSLQLEVHRRQSSLTSPTTSTVSGISSTQLSNPSTPSSNPLAAALSFAGLNFRSHRINSAANLTLTPHHLFYLLSRVEELDIDVGSMSVRIENLQSDPSPSNYISFLQAHGAGNRPRSDRDSIHSVSSMRSVMSSMTTFWSSMGIGSSTSKTEKAKAQTEADLKYIYSAFTKLPALRLTADPHARLIRGYEQFPFDTAVPLYSFKNLQQLDIVDQDFRSFYGWDRLADQLCLLTVKRAHLDDPTELLADIVLDDAERRRRRSTKGGRSSPTPTSSWTVPSTPRGEYARSHSDPGSPADASPRQDEHGFSRDGVVLAGSTSPKRPIPARPASSYRHSRSYSTKASRSGSGSSNSSEYSFHPHRADSTSNLLTLNILPASKWQRLKYLSLADNSLTFISAKSLAPVASTLRSLNLASNLFTEIPDCLASLTRLTSLDLSNCMIGSLQSLTKSPLPAITTLNIKSNRLHSLAGVEKLPSLEVLNIRGNALTDPMEVARLTGLPNLRKIWVKHNPLVRTHSSYRVTMFNLFRSTPGYVEDMIIDDSGPGYSESKLLVERVPEVERKISQQPTVRIEMPTVPRSERFVVEEIETPEISKASSRRRKHARRRIVDLAHDDTPWRANADVKVVSRPSIDSRRSTDGRKATDPVTRGQITDSKAVTESVAKQVQEEETIVIQDGEFVGEAAGEEEGIEEGGITTMDQQDEYRNQAEALRRELGSTWLSALGEQGWHNSQLNHQMEVQRGQSHGHAAGLHRANTLVVTNGRTLG